MEGSRQDDSRAGDRRRVLPVLADQPGERPERADAARNRRKIVDAASRIRAERGTAAVSLDEVAREAGLGVGTVYRRFRDRGSLLYSLLDDRERAFQSAFTAGPPPLGPGAAPAVRIHAFLRALADHVIANLELMAEAECSSLTGKYQAAPYNVWRLHLIVLLAELRPGADHGYLADALLAPLSATLISYQMRERGLTADAIKAGLDTLLAGIC